MISTNSTIREHINGHLVEFYPELHHYYVDGIKVMSVSEICKLEHPEMYQGIDENILKKAAFRGTSLHKEIEEYEHSGVLSYSLEFNNYLKIKANLNFKKDLSEKMIIIKQDHQVICAGRFDMLATMNNQTALIDFKRTSQIHQSYVSLQLNLYRIGLIQCYSKTIDLLMLIRLKDYASDIVSIDIDENRVYQVLSKYISK